MKRKLVKGIKAMAGFLAVMGLFLVGVHMPVFAAGSVNVTVDKASASISDTVTFHVEASEPEDPATATEITVTYDPDILTFLNCDVEYGGGGGGLITIVGQSANISFTAAAIGETSVNVEAVIDDEGNHPATGAVSVTVGASEGKELSSDATLRMLTVSPGDMTPAFSPEVTEYTICVEKNVEDIAVSGGVTSDKAQITAASGFKNLKIGTNQAVITVTAEDGSTRKYNFTILRGKEGEGEEEEDGENQTEEDMQTETVMGDGMRVTIDETSYTIQTSVSEEMLPDGCVKTTADFNGTEIETALFEVGGLLLLYAIPDGEEEGDFFIYNQSNGNLQIFVQLRSIENRFIVPVEPQETPPAVFTAEKLQWNNSYIPAYKLADTSVENVDFFYLVYAISNEGEKGFYLYDTLEGTYQRFLNCVGAVAETKQPAGTKYAVIGGLSIALVALLMVIVNLLIRNRELEADMAESEGLRKGWKEKPKREKRVKEIKKPEEKQAEAKKMETPPAAPKQAKKTPDKPKARVPIYTLERQPVPLTREAPPDQLDDDFEFTFINIDND